MIKPLFTISVLALTTIVSGCGVHSYTPVRTVQVYPAYDSYYYDDYAYPTYYRQSNVYYSSPVYYKDREHDNRHYDDRRDDRQHKDYKRDDKKRDDRKRDDKKSRDSHRDEGQRSQAQQGHKISQPAQIRPVRPPQLSQQHRQPDRQTDRQQAEGNRNTATAPQRTVNRDDGRSQTSRDNRQTSEQPQQRPARLVREETERRQ